MEVPVSPFLFPLSSCASSPSSSHKHGDRFRPPPASASVLLPEPSLNHPRSTSTSEHYIPSHFSPTCFSLVLPVLGKRSRAQVHTPSHSVPLPPSHPHSSTHQVPLGLLFNIPRIHHSVMMCQAPTVQGFGTLFIQEFVQYAFFGKPILCSTDLTHVFASNSGGCPTWHLTSLNPALVIDLNFTLVDQLCLSSEAAWEFDCSSSLGHPVKWQLG